MNDWISLPIASLLFILYVTMLWLTLFRHPTFRGLPRRDQWSVLTSAFGVMPTWMIISILVVGAIDFTMPFFNATVCSVSKWRLLSFWPILFSWPLASWVAFRIAFRRLERPQRRQAILHLFKRVSVAFALAFSTTFLFFHFCLAGGHSFDHLFEMGPRNFGAMNNWVKNLELQDDMPIYSEAGYCSSFPVHEECLLCRFEAALGSRAWRRVLYMKDDFPKLSTNVQNQPLKP